MPEIESEYETPDIYLAAYFDVAGCTMKRKRNEGKRVFFVFENVAGSMKSMRDDFYSGRAKVIAHQFSERIKAYKEMCF
jgi:hypothetical protein